MNIVKHQVKWLGRKKNNSKGDRKHTTRELRGKPEMCSAMAAKRGETIIRDSEMHGFGDHKF